MQDTTAPVTPPVITSSGRGIWYSSIIFLVITLSSILLLYILTQSTEKKILTIDNEIAKLDEDIKKLNIDPNIVITKIVQENGVRPSMDLKKIVTEFRRAAIKSNVSFDGFSIKDDTITTTLISTSGNSQHPDPVGRIVSMMNDYAKNEGQEFRLGKITNISGDIERRSTTIELKLVSTPK